MRLHIPVFFGFISVLGAFETSFASSWALMLPDLKIVGTTLTPTNKWVPIESFTTLAECNDRRSFMIRQIAKERRALKDLEPSDAEMTERELRFLLEIYTRSKCAQSR